MYDLTLPEEKAKLLILPYLDLKTWFLLIFSLTIFQSHYFLGCFLSNQTHFYHQNLTLATVFNLNILLQILYKLFIEQGSFLHGMSQLHINSNKSFLHDSVKCVTYLRPFLIAPFFISFLIFITVRLSIFCLYMLFEYKIIQFVRAKIFMHYLLPYCQMPRIFLGVYWFSVNIYWTNEWMGKEVVHLFIDD